MGTQVPVPTTVFGVDIRVTVAGVVLGNIRLQGAHAARAGKNRGFQIGGVSEGLVDTRGRRRNVFLGDVADIGQRMGGLGGRRPNSRKSCEQHKMTHFHERFLQLK